jgi:hypothetical protein
MTLIENITPLAKIPKVNKTHAPPYTPTKTSSDISLYLPVDLANQRDSQ